jgi:excisionase family DNA binding protein
MQLLGTKELAEHLGINEKKVYALISEKGLPATKITGKWLFPRDLVERWIEKSTENHPGPAAAPPPYEATLLIAGSNDPLLEKAMALFARLNDGHIAAFANLGSLGGLGALRRGQCHLASSHLIEEEEQGGEYNFAHAARELDELPAVVNFCRREQGLVLAPGNPKGIASLRDLARKDATLVNRRRTTGTRLLLEKKLKEEGLDPRSLKGFDRKAEKHLDVGIEVLSGRADAGPCIRAVAGLLGLEFIPFTWERFDLLVPKKSFFTKGVQLFLSLLHEEEFRSLADGLAGYDVSGSGRMVFPREGDFALTGGPGAAQE